MTRNALILLTIGVLAITAGCRPIDFYATSIQEPIPPEMEPPRELSMVSLPQYRVVPSDAIWLSVLKLVPQPSYRLGPGDELEIKALGTLPKHSIRHDSHVEPDGNLELGPPYGVVRVAGLTLAEAEAEIIRSLKLLLAAPQVTVQLTHSAAAKNLDGGYMVEIDGTINLRNYGTVHVVGKTVGEVRSAVRERLGQYFDSPDVGVDVYGYNGNKYYVIIGGKWIGGINSDANLATSHDVTTPGTIYVPCPRCGRGLTPDAQVGDPCPSCTATYGSEDVANLDMRKKAAWLDRLPQRISPFMVLGNETVLDAISQVSRVQPLPPMSNQSIWIARPTPGDSGEEQILPVDWSAIKQGITDTNYQILPGDRLYIVDDRVVAVNQFVNKFAAPIGRFVGIANLTAVTVKGTQTLGRGYNKLRSSRRNSGL